MRIDDAFRALMRLDDGVLMRGAFFVMLSAAGIFLLHQPRPEGARKGPVA
ncbi:hypothetical protein [Sinorhizobium medicae]|nr:hypothetical protein [Sinorhizobium medicae]